MQKVIDHVVTTLENEEGQTTTEYAAVIAAVLLMAGAGIALLQGVLEDFFAGITL